MNEQLENHYDIVIVGGGIVGLTMANCLLGSNLKIAVIERSEPTVVTDEVSNRVSAINRAAIAIFQKTGVWQHMTAERLSVFQKMHVWDSTGVGQIDFDGAELGVPALGYIIENNIIQQALRINLQDSEAIDWLCPRTIQSVELTHAKHFVRLEDGSELSCRLLIGADGGQSLVRQAANIEFQRKQYGQLGVVATVATELPHDKTAWQCFLPTGPLAFLPLADGRCSIVWSLDEDRANTILSLDDDAFMRELEQAFEFKLGSVTAVSQREAYPLSHGHVNAYVQTGLALIGDAAHTIHPLAGQGANLGIMDALCLSDIIKTAVEQNRQWSALHTLRRYERQRKGDNLIMEASMSGFKALFGNEDPLLSTIRNAGLNAVNRLPMVKNQFVQHALGLD